MITISMDRRLRMAYRRFNRVVYTLTPSAARRIIFRVMRQMPRMALLAIASAGVVKSSDVLFPKFLSLWSELTNLMIQSLRFRDTSGALYDGINALIAVYGVIGVVLLGAAGTIGLALLCGLKLSMFKTMQYLVFCSMAFLAMAVALTPVSSIAESAVDAHIAQGVVEGKVFFLTTQLRAETAARILADEQNGRWWATPEDGPAALAIKAVLRTGTAFGKSSVSGELKEVADPNLRHSTRAIE